MRIVDWQCDLIGTEAGIRLATRYGEPPQRREHVIVRLIADDGHYGLGEASPLSWFTGETPATVQAILVRHWLPRLIGEDPHHIVRVHERLSEDLAANSSARSAIDMALHDLCARAARLPLCDYLGGHGATTLPRTYPLGIGPPDEMAAQAQRWVERGYRTLKIKIDRSVASARTTVGAVREAVGPDVDIRVDANAGLDLTTARAMVRALEPFDLELVEQPLPAQDRSGWRALRRSVGIPLMADESLHTARDALELVSERSVDFLVIKLVKTGGIRGACQIAAVAEAADVRCVVSTPFDTSVGAAAATHLAFVIGSRDHAHDLPPGEYETAQTVGQIHRPAGPGIGVEGLPASEPSWAGEAV